MGRDGDSAQPSKWSRRETEEHRERAIDEDGGASYGRGAVEGGNDWYQKSDADVEDDAAGARFEPEGNAPAEIEDGADEEALEGDAKLAFEGGRRLWCHCDDCGFVESLLVSQVIVTAEVL